MEYKITPKATTYKGRLYRSRLEARYAAFFDIKGFECEYEPVDLNGWSPDFLLKSKVFCSYVEIKPIKSLDELGEEYIRKLILAGAPLLNDFTEVRIQGETPLHMWLLSKNHLSFDVKGNKVPSGYHFCPASTPSNTEKCWIMAANKVMFYKPNTDEHC